MLPVVLAVGSSIPGLPVQTLMLLCVYSLGLMGVISPYATGTGADVLRQRLYRQRRLLEVPG